MYVCRGVVGAGAAGGNCPRNFLGFALMHYLLNSKILIYCLPPQCQFSDYPLETYTAVASILGCKLLCNVLRSKNEVLKKYDQTLRRCGEQYTLGTVF